MNSFAENVNYVASLDNRYGRVVELYKNNVSLRNELHDIVITLQYYNYADRKIHDIVYTYDNIAITGLSAVLSNFQSQINGAGLFTCIASFSYTNFVINNVATIDIKINSKSDDIKTYGLNVNITKDSTELYDINGTVSDTLKILPTVALFDSELISNIGITVDNADSIKTNALNIGSINNVSTNINSVNTVSIDIANVNAVGTNINDVKTNALRAMEIKRVADDLNAVDLNGRSDIIVVSDNLSKGIDSEIVKVSENIDSVITSGEHSAEIDIVANNIASIVVDANNISSINLIASDLTMAGLYNIVDAGSIVDNIDTTSPGTSMIETVSDNIVNVNAVGSNINAVIGVNNNETNINSIVSDVIPVIAEILLSDENAATATAKALEASNSETMAHKWSSEPEDSIVAGVLGVNEEYSAYHWAKKAEAAAGGNITLDSLYDVDTNGILDGGMIRYDLATTSWKSYDFARNDKLGLDTTANITVGIGEIAWNADEGTADLGLPGGSTLQIGQENIRTIRNSTASTITDGTLCMFNGTIGNSGRIKVKPFTAGFNEAMYLYGVATQTITPGSDGIITIEGKVRGINTTGASVGEVWSDGDILYAKPNDNGRMTNVVPADNELKLVVATVIHAHTNGVLEIRFTTMNENMYYTKVQNDILLNSKVPLEGDFTLDLGGIV